MYDKLSYLINVKMKLLSLLISKIEVKIANTSQNRKRKYIQRRGGQIGAETILLSGADCFGSEPYLVNIGDKCLISSNVSFITHDGAVSVLNNLNLFEDRIDKMRAIKVGDNTFIGTGVVIMPGVTIGNNCVIGAGSVVTKSVPDFACVAGVPAKYICSIYEYADKNKQYFYPTFGMSYKDKKEYLLTHMSEFNISQKQ